MNYRHAFHAGNFADVFKHVLLSRILLYLGRKPAPFRYIDTHAGVGRYDLGGTEATRTAEWRTGIGRFAASRLADPAEALLAPYRACLGATDAARMPVDYPGSPAVAQQLLRPIDRLLLAELHPDDHRALRQALGRDPRVRIVNRDGYEMLGAAVPPPERRGLVLIDPPFERSDEFGRIAEALDVACRKWPTGTYAVWYPIKAAAPVAAFYADLHGLALPQGCRLELLRDEDPRDSALRGCGLLVLNPPYVLADEARALLPALAALFEDDAERPYRSLVAELPSGR